MFQTPTTASDCDTSPSTAAQANTLPLQTDIHSQFEGLMATPSATSPHILAAPHIQPHIVSVTPIQTNGSEIITQQHSTHENDQGVPLEFVFGEGQSCV